MKNQNSISKPTVIIKPPPSVSVVPSSKKEKLSIENKMDLENNQQQFYDDLQQQNHDFPMNFNEKLTTADIPSTPLTDKEAKEQEIIIYEFHFPVELCGRLIGRQGVHVDYIRQMTQVDLVVRDDAVSFEKQVVALHGRRVDIEQAIELIAKRFPPARYPQVAFKPINKKIVLRQRPPERVPIPQSAAQLQLPDGIPTEVLVTSVVSCNHIFVQQILHPSYAELARLDNSMSVFYHHTEMTPHLPRPIQTGVICAAPTQAGWFRALITVYNTNDDMAMIKFLDYGGYLYVHASSLRVLRQDFMVIPFQAIEVYLDNVVPGENQEDFTSESIELVKTTVLGSSFKAMVTGYHYDNTPFIQLSRRYDFQRLVNIDIQKMINNYQQTSVPNDSTLPTNVINNSNSTNIQPMINQLQQSVSDISTLSSTTNSDS
jgi:A-kinase anchor protein 1